MSERLTITKKFMGAPESIFSDFVVPEKLEHWFFEEDYWSAQAKVDLRPGGEYSIEMLTDIGNSFMHDGKFLEISPRKDRLKFTWDSSLVDNSVVTVDFNPTAAGMTEVIIVHDNLPNEKMLDIHKRIWEGCLRHLDEYVNNPTPYPIFHDPEYQENGTPKDSDKDFF